VEYGPQDPDLSMGRTPDGTRTPPVCLGSATPGSANSSECSLRILEIALPSPETVQLTWRSIPGEDYIVERSGSMAPGSWTEVTELITAERFGTTAEVERLENQGAAYFRVKNVTP
ncbi:MAG: hypothetical protein OET79_14360, partial [Nitrospirota bacterium]|nr:hypothetical protein [Nitrospirota bacterium]